MLGHTQALISLLLRGVRLPNRQLGRNLWHIRFVRALIRCGGRRRHARA